MRFAKQMIVLLGIGIGGIAHAADVHIWNDVRSLSGVWDVSINMISEIDKGYFVDEQGNFINNFNLNDGQRYRFGFGFKDGADFNMAYAVTMTNKDSITNFTEKACVFIVTATAPGQTDMLTKSYNGATCVVNRIPGSGVEFVVGT